jgi:hypothetical protein
MRLHDVCRRNRAVGAEESSDDEVESVRSVQFTEFRGTEFISAKSNFRNHSSSVTGLSHEKINT